MTDWTDLAHLRYQRRNMRRPVTEATKQAMFRDASGLTAVQNIQ